MNKLALITVAAVLQLRPAPAPEVPGLPAKAALARAVHIHLAASAKDLLGSSYFYPGKQIKKGSSGYKLTKAAAYFVMVFVERGPDGRTGGGEGPLRARIRAGASVLGETGIVLTNGGRGGPVVVPVWPSRGPTGNAALTVELLDANGLIDQWSTSAVIVAPN